MNIILAAVKFQPVFVHIYNAVIFSKETEKDLRRNESIFRLIQETRMMLKLKNWFFPSDTISCLGNVTTFQRLFIATNTIDAICNLWYLMTASELRLFSGFCIVYRQFVLRFLRLLAPLNKTLKKAKQAKRIGMPKNEKRWKVWSRISLLSLS